MQSVRSILRQRRLTGPCRLAAIYPRNRLRSTLLEHGREDIAAAAHHVSELPVRRTLEAQALIVRIDSPGDLLQGIIGRYTPRLAQAAQGHLSLHTRMSTSPALAKASLEGKSTLGIASSQEVDRETRDAHQESKSVEERLERLLQNRMSAPVEGAAGESHRSPLIVRSAGVHKLSDLLCRVERMSAVLDLAAELLDGVGAAGCGRLGVSKSDNEEREHSEMKRDRNQDSLGSTISEQNGAEKEVGPSKSRTSVPSAQTSQSRKPSESNTRRRMTESRRRLPAQLSLALSSAIADLSPRLITLLATNISTDVKSDFLEILESVSRRNLVREITAVGLRSSALPGLSDVDQETQGQRLKHWRGRARLEMTEVDQQEDANALSTARQAHELVLTLLLVRQRRKAQPGRASGASDRIRSSIDDVAKECYAAYLDARPKPKRIQPGNQQAMAKRMRPVMEELLFLRLTLDFLAKDHTQVIHPASSEAKPTVTLAGALGLLAGLSQKLGHGEIWERCSNALASTMVSSTIPAIDLSPIDALAFRSYLRTFEMQDPSHNPRGVSAKLEQLLRDKDLERFSALWDEITSMLRRGRTLEQESATKSGESSPAEQTVIPRDTRSAWIVGCLTALVRCADVPLVANGTVPVHQLVTKILETHGGTNSSGICQALLLLRDKALMNQDMTAKLSIAERHIFIGQSVRGYWANLAAQGVEKEIPLYQEYMRLLGKYNDFNGLVDVWEEMRVDVGCEARYRAACKSDGDAASYPPISIFNHFISILLNNKQRVANSQKLALSMFDYLLDPASPSKPNLETMNTMIRHHCKKLDIPSIMKILVRISELGLKADVVTYTTVVQCFLDAGRRADALRILDAMDAEGIKRNQYLWSKIIAETARSGKEADLKEAERALVDMRKEGFDPNVVTWTGLIGGYFRGGYDERAMDRLKRMMKEGIVLNTVTCNMILRGCMGVGAPNSYTTEGNPFNPRIAFNILAMMRENGTKPDEDTWYLLLHGFVTHGMLKEASLIVEEMDKAGFVVPRDAGLARDVRAVAGWRRSQGW